MGFWSILSIHQVHTNAYQKRVNHTGIYGHGPRHPLMILGNGNVDGWSWRGFVRAWTCAILMWLCEIMIDLSKVPHSQAVDYPPFPLNRIDNAVFNDRTRSTYFKIARTMTGLNPPCTRPLLPEYGLAPIAPVSTRFCLILKYWLTFSESGKQGGLYPFTSQVQHHRATFQSFLSPKQNHAWCFKPGDSLPLLSRMNDRLQKRIPRAGENHIVFEAIKINGWNEYGSDRVDVFQMRKRMLLITLTELTEVIFANKFAGFVIQLRHSSYFE
jgi:hypothetical protein